MKVLKKTFNILYFIAHITQLQRTERIWGDNLKQKKFKKFLHKMNMSYQAMFSK